MSQTQEN